MRYLLDAHTLLWSQDDTSRLSTVATAALTDPAHDRLVSMASIWEIGIKVAIGKLSLSKPFRAWMETAIGDQLATGGQGRQLTSQPGEHPPHGHGMQRAFIDRIAREFKLGILKRLAVGGLLFNHRPPKGSNRSSRGGTGRASC